MANEDDVKLQFGADFTSALQSVNDFFDGIRRSTVGSGTGLGKLPEELEEVSTAAKQTTAQIALMAAALGAALAAFAAFTAAVGVLYVGFRAVSVAGEFFVDSLKLAMKAEDEAYEKAVKLAEAQGRLAPANHTLSESFKELNEIIEDAKAQLGEAFLPTIKDFVEIAKVLAERLRDIVAAWAEWAKATADDNGLSNLETLLIRISAHIIAAAENVKGFILQLENAAFIAANTFTWANEEETAAAMDDFNSRMKKKYGFTGEDAWIPEYAKGNEELTKQFQQAKAAQDYASALNNPLGSADRVNELIEEMTKAVAVNKNEEREGGVEDAVVKNKQSILDAFKQATSLIADGVIEGSKKGSKLYEGFTDKAKGVFDEYAKGVAESEEVQWAEARKIVAGFAEPEKRERFQGGIEDSVSVFRRIQSAMGSQEEIPKQQLTVAQEQLKRMVEARDAQMRIDGGIGELISVVKGGVPAVAQ